MSFFEYLNSRDPNIKFTTVTETDKQTTSLTTSVFLKSTYTGLLLNYT